MRPGDIEDAGPRAAEVLVDGPFAASTLFWRARRGELRCTIVAKTTYALLPHRCPVVDPSEPLEVQDLHWDGKPDRSVRVPSDLVPFKHAPEVIVVGHAYAPGRRPQKRLGVRIVVGDLDQALEVFAPRRFHADGALEEPSALRMPLAYEFASGGSGSDNPVGVDMGLVDAWGRRGAPSVLPLATACEQPTDVVPPAGWGPIASSWPSRARRLRAEDRAWLADPLRAPMPAGFDVRYFQSAPATHWLSGALRADERIVLENLSPAYERIVTTLEGIAPMASLLGSKELRIPLVADTLFLDTDRAVLTLTWRGLVMVDPRASRLVLGIARADGTVAAAPPVFYSAPPPPDVVEASEVEATHVEARADAAPRESRTKVAEPSGEGPIASGWTSLREDGAGAIAGPTWSIESPDTSDDPVRAAFEPAPRRFALVDLLSHDPALPARLRRAPAFARVLEVRGDRPVGARARRSLSEPDAAVEETGAASSRDERDRGDVLRVLSFGAPCDLRRAREIVEEALDDPEQLDVPLVVLAGTIAPTLDEMAVLRAIAGAGRALGAVSEPLLAALDAASAAGAAPSGEAVSALLRKVEHAAGAHHGALLEHGARAALEERHFKRRTLFGEARIRVSFTAPGEEPVPAYVPAAVAPRLPMLRSFPAVIVAELRPREDAQEAHPEALHVLALGRVLRRPDERGASPS